MTGSEIPREWLTTKLVSGTSALFSERERDEQIGELARRFVNLRCEWDRLFTKIGPDDEIWEFSSPPDHWVSLCGRAGIALVREGNPIEDIVTEMN